jgi:hypothetical protein
MAAELSSLTGRSVRVYCPSHKVNFDVAANATIECSSGTHALATNFPNENFWEYCCDCQHYRPIDATGKGSDECPVCERKIVRRSVCADCKVISVESNEAGRRKAFSLRLVPVVCGEQAGKVSHTSVRTLRSLFSPRERRARSATNRLSHYRLFLARSRPTSRSYRNPSSPSDLMRKVDWSKSQHRASVALCRQLATRRYR